MTSSTTAQSGTCNVDSTRCRTPQRGTRHCINPQTTNLSSRSTAAPVTCGGFECLRDPRTGGASGESAVDAFDARVCSTAGGSRAGATSTGACVADGTGVGDAVTAAGVTGSGPSSAGSASGATGSTSDGNSSSAGAAGSGAGAAGSGEGASCLREDFDLLLSFFVSELISCGLGTESSATGAGNSAESAAAGAGSGSGAADSGSGSGSSSVASGTRGASGSEGLAEMRMLRFLAPERFCLVGSRRSSADWNDRTAGGRLRRLTPVGATDARRGDWRSGGLATGPHGARAPGGPQIMKK